MTHVFSEKTTKQINVDLRQRHPEMPWADMAGRRDVIVHQYFAVQLETVWTTIRDRFPSIRDELQHIADKIASEE